MAATGYTPISLYYSTTASAVPTAGNLANGELALNIADMKLYAKNSAGTVTLLASNSGATGTVSSVSGTGTVSGITLSGTVTSSGSLTLGGALDLSAYNGAGAFTTLSASGAVTLSGGTANGVTYLNGSKVLTSGSALTFDGTNLGLGTAPVSLSSQTAITIRGTSISRIDMQGAAGAGGGSIAGSATSMLVQANYGIPLILDSGTTSFTRFDVASTEAMRLTSTSLYTASGINVGIGTSSPANKLHVQTSTTGDGIGARISTSDASGVGSQAINLGGYLGGNQGVALKAHYNYGATNATSMSFWTTNAAGTQNEGMRLDSAGNLGLGVTPSAWQGAFEALQFGDYAGIGSSREMTLFTNAYQNSAGDGIYQVSSLGASKYDQYNGVHAWYTAGSGTAGNAISFTQAMTLDASGNLLVGTTSTSSSYSRTLAMANGGSVGISFNDQSIPRQFAIGTRSGNLVFDDNTAGAERARISSTGGFSVGTTADPGAGAIYATGAITAYYSDERLKDVKGRIQNALAKVRRLSGVYYTNNETAKALGYTSDEMQVGVLANQMKGELPEIVKPAPFDLDENGNSKSGENYMTVQYERGFPLLIEALKELADQFDDYVATH